MRTKRSSIRITRFSKRVWTSLNVCSTLEGQVHRRPYRLPSGGDHLAALRDPARLAMDMIENLEHVKTKLRQSMDEYFKVYDFFYDMLRAEGMPISTWTPAIHDGRYYVPPTIFRA